MLPAEKVQFVVKPRKTNVNWLESALLSALPNCRGFGGEHLMRSGSKWFPRCLQGGKVAHLDKIPPACARIPAGRKHMQ